MTDNARTRVPGNKTNTATKKVRRKKKQEEKMTAGMAVMLITILLGFILGIVSIFFLSTKVVIDNLQIVMVLLAFASFSAIFHFIIHKTSETKEKLSLPFFFAFNVVGSGGVLLFLFFILNSSLASENIDNETYRIVGLDPEYQVYRGGLCVYILEDHKFDHDVYLRTLKYANHTMGEVKGDMIFKFRQGGFGFRLIEGHRVQWDVKP